MFRKLTLAAAAGAGYVMGAKAGKERYTQIEAKFREIAGMPAVQNATAAVKDTASGVAESAKSTVTEKTSSSSSSTPSSTSPDLVVDLGTGASAQPVTASPSGSTTSSGLGSATSESGLGGSTGTSGLGGSTGTTSTSTPGTMAGASASTTAPDITRP